MVSRVAVLHPYGCRRGTPRPSAPHGMTYEAFCLWSQSAARVFCLGFGSSGYSRSHCVTCYCVIMRFGACWMGSDVVPAALCLLPRFRTLGCEKKLDRTRVTAKHTRNSGCQATPLKDNTQSHLRSQRVMNSELGPTYSTVTAKGNGQLSKQKPTGISIALQSYTEFPSSTPYVQLACNYQYVP